MQFDNSILHILIFNLILIFAITLFSIKLLQNTSCCVRYADTYLSSGLINSTAPKNLQVKKYLLIRRKIKTDPDDDSPYSYLLVL